MQEASSPKIRSSLLVELLKSRRLINDQVLGKILFNSMSMSNMRLALDGDSNMCNARDGALRYFTLVVQQTGSGVLEQVIWML